MQFMKLMVMMMIIMMMMMMMVLVMMMMMKMMMMTVMMIMMMIMTHEYHTIDLSSPRERSLGAPESRAVPNVMPLMCL